jgi:hypothetical protein
MVVVVVVVVVVVPDEHGYAIVKRTQVILEQSFMATLSAKGDALMEKWEYRLDDR